MGAEVLARLDAAAAKVDPKITRVILSINGFTSNLERLASKRSDVQLIDVHRLYSGT